MIQVQNTRGNASLLKRYKNTYRYRDLLKRLGSNREQDSLTCQLHFIIALLPSDENGTRMKESQLKTAKGIRSKHA